MQRSCKIDGQKDMIYKFFSAGKFQLSFDVASNF